MPFLSKNARRLELGLTSGPGAAVSAGQGAADSAAGTRPGSGSRSGKWQAAWWDSLTAFGRTMLSQLRAGPARGRGLAEVHRHLLDADGAE